MTSNPKLKARLAEAGPGGYTVHLGGRQIGWAGFQPRRPGETKRSAWYQIEGGEPVELACLREADLKRAVRDALQQAT